MAQHSERVPTEQGILEIWQLGNLAARWAEAPLAITPDELDEYRELCDKAGADPALLLYRFQEYWSQKNLPPDLPTLQAPVIPPLQEDASFSGHVRDDD